ncbi:MAG: polysaccharide biosynthesis/export family protein [Mucilaginibacter sp.]|uniref:polysaccharide biosynthesis/export family protein n=1 Tax=Mucilaginibacter sp. TaxID=1882438 RepID=UPI0031AB882C
MSKKYFYSLFFIALVTTLALELTSCSSTKNVKYFQDIPDSGKLAIIPKAEYSEPKIKVDDILNILIQTIDPAATQIINTGNVATGGPGSSPSAGAAAVASMAGNSQQGISGYLVDKNGNVDIPVLGKVKAAGYTTAEFRDSVLSLAGKYYKDPTVIVRFANFKITVTGEVLKPGQYIVPNEKVSVLDGIAMAGDLTILAKRDNVLLIRENEDGTKTPYRINLKKSDIMSAPYYYLRQNDIIYVEPGKGKAAANDASQTRYITILASALSVLIVFLSRR